MANIFNNDDISPLFSCILFSVCSIMLRKGNHWILFFIGVGQCSSLSTQLHFFFSEGLYMLAFVFISYSAASRWGFHFWSNYGWWVSLICGATYVLKMVIICYFYHWILDWYRMNDNLNWLTGYLVYLMWKEWWYNIAWFCMNWLLLMHQLCLLPEMEVFLNCFHYN